MYGFTFGTTLSGGVMTDGKHTYRDFGLKMFTADIPMPELKVNKVSIPYRDGDLDLTDIYGKTFYKDRENVTFEFRLGDKSYQEYETIKSNIANALHGKKYKVVMDYDPEFYYVMRLAVSSEKSNKYASTIVLTGSAEPYKYKVLASSENWLWDPFNFVNGVITSIGTFTVNGTKVLRMPIGHMLTSPTFICSNIQSTPFTVSDGTTTLNLVSGENYDPRIKISGDEEVNLTFTGRGTVTIVYRGGSL